MAKLDLAVAGEGTLAPASTTQITLRINGVVRTLQIEPRVSLLDALREYLGLTGTKKGCNQGSCGACTVLVDGERILSCLAFAVQHEGTEITTVEGLGADGALHALQAAFAENDGFSVATVRQDRSVRQLGCFESFKTVCQAR